MNGKNGTPTTFSEKIRHVGVPPCRPVFSSPKKLWMSRLFHVRHVGQGFADEIFRVFASRHPGIVIRLTNTTPAVEAMIRHVGGPGR